MGSLASMVVKIGADVNDFEKNLSKAERTMLNFGRNIEAVGKKLSLAVTLPLVGLGAAAVKAAADMDSLKRGLIAVSGSSAAAEKQLVRLREVAKLPGLGFEEAVQGSINLQAAGFSAALAERSLKAFGNALATVGRGKAELDGVVLALQQIAAKGKITAEDINQIQERVPQIRQAMKAAFGTADTQVLQKLGIDAKEFVTRVVAELEKLPSVTGGVKNSFENLGDSVKFLANRVGEQLLPPVIALVDWLAKVTTKLNEAHGGSLRTAIAVATVAAAIGPLISLIGGLTKAVILLRGASVAMMATLGIAGGVIAVLGVLSAWFIKNKLDAAAAAGAVDKYKASLDGLNAKSLSSQHAGLILGLAENERLLKRTPKFTTGAIAASGDPLAPGMPTRTANPAFKRLLDQRKDLAEMLRSVKAAESMSAQTSAPPAPPPPGDADTVAAKVKKALGAAFDRVAARLGSAMSQIGMRPANNEDFLSARQDNPFDVKYKPRPSIFLPVQRTVQVPAVPALDVPTRFDRLRANAAKFGGNLKDRVGELVAQFGPVALAAAALKPVFDGLRKALGPAVSALVRPLEVVGELIGGVIAPLLKLFAAPLRLVTKATSYVVEAFGYLVLGIGKAAGGLSFGLFGKGLRKTGQDMIDGARAARSGLEKAGAAATEFAEALSNVPRVVNIAALRHRVTSGVGMGEPGGGGGSGGGGGGYHPPPYTPGDHPRPAPVMNFAAGSFVFHGSGDPQEAAEQVGRVLDRLANRGGTSRLALAASR